MRLPTNPPAVALLLFGVALALRVLFGHAGPDAEWPYSVVYKGDALLWLRHALALERGVPFELGLPLRPPGNAYLIAWLWDGSPEGVGRLELVWQALGAALAPATFLGLRGTLGAGRAALAGGLVACSGALLGLSSSLNNETPYLLLAVVGMGLHASLARSPRAIPLALWGLVAAAGCLFRVEHALYFAPALVHLALRHARLADPARASAALRTAGLALGVFALALVPWHRAAWASIERLNEVERALDPNAQAALASIEQRTSVLLWTPAARAERERLPAFARRSASAFVAATVLHRGGSSVDVADFGVLDEAFGTRPRALGARPFVALYGPLNFALANAPGSSGGFDRGLLQTPPPLEGGAARYPAALVAGLPPAELAFEYPPHLELVNHGYRVGFSAIAADPGAWLGLVGRKLGRFLDGVGQGVGGFNLPVGRDVRRAVDLAAPTGLLAEAWAALTVAGALLGAYRLRGELASLAPWSIFLLGKLVVVVAFFGYARQGALAVVALAPFWAAALLPQRAPAAGVRRILGTALAGAAVLLLALEVVRTAVGVSVRLDGVPVTAEADPAPLSEHADRRLEFSLGRTE